MLLRTALRATWHRTHVLRPHKVSSFIKATQANKIPHLQNESMISLKVSNVIRNWVSEQRI